MRMMLVLVISLSLLFAFGNVALADENPMGAVSFNIKWEVEPRTVFAVFTDTDDATFDNGELVLGSSDFGDYVFEPRTPYSEQDFATLEQVCGPERIVAIVASNDWWRVQLSVIRVALIYVFGVFNGTFVGLHNYESLLKNPIS